MKKLAAFFKHATTGIRHDLLICVFAILATLAVIPIITYIYFAKDLASKDIIVNKNDSGVVLLDRNNQPFFTFYQTRLRKEVPISQIPKITQQAFIAMEDKDFYSNPGFSIKSIFRSFISNLQRKSLAYGGSTITQQLVKNSLLTPKKEFIRKYQEIVLAQEIDRRYSKDQILEMYLNSVYLGEGVFGVQEAANTYFNKNAQDLSLAESALLAAILPAPSQLSLITGDFNEAKKRQEIILDKMQEQHYINAKQKDEAKKQQINITVNHNEVNTIAPHFALMVKDQLIQEYGEEVVARSGFKVKTTLDLGWQKYAEESVKKHVDLLKPNGVTNGAAVVLDPKNGEIRALVGSKDWYDPQFGKVNIIVSQRPPGSSFKPIVYIRALERHLITAATLLKDQPTTFANFDEQKYFASWPTRLAAMNALKNDPNAYYKPLDYDRRFRGLVTARRALSNSLNIPAVEVLQKVGVDDAVETAKRFGLTTLKDPSNYGLSLVLGTTEVKPLELTNFYATMANKGYENKPTSILQIEDKHGNLIYQYQPELQKIIDEKYTFLISSILSDNKTRAETFGSALNISRPAAVKTGTTEDFKDAWTIGFTPSLVVGVWVGNNFGEPMDGVAGSMGAAPIWKDLMETFSQNTPVEEFQPPDEILKASYCTSKKGEASSSATIFTQYEYFELGTEPKNNCIVTKAIDKT